MDSKKFKFLVKDISEEKVVLEFDGSQELTVDLDDLPSDIKVGDALFATFGEIEEEKTIRDMAKESINEILNPE